MTDSSAKVADSSFDDDELADIMAEIEGLEKEALGAERSESTAALIDANEDELTAPVSSSSENLAEENNGEQDLLLAQEMTSLSTEENDSDTLVNSLQEAIDKEMEAAKGDSKLLTFPDRETAKIDTDSVSIARSNLSPTSSPGVQGPFSLNCNMSEFKINFQVEGQNFSLEVGPECGVCLTLADGAKLSVPWKKKVA